MKYNDMDKIESPFIFMLTEKDKVIKKMAYKIFLPIENNENNKSIKKINKLLYLLYFLFVFLLLYLLIFYFQYYF